MESEDGALSDNVYISMGDNKFLSSNEIHKSDDCNELQKSHSQLEASSKCSGDMKSAKRKLIQASAICAAFMIVEIIAGSIANSLALMTDALHLVSDLSSFLISLFALWISSLHGTHQLSFGYHRAEILGALLSVVFIWLCTGILVVEAIRRLLKPAPVSGSIMFVTAFFGTLANIVMTCILGLHSHHHAHDHKHTFNHAHSPRQSLHHHEEKIHKDSDNYRPLPKGIANDLHDALLPPLARHNEDSEAVVDKAYHSTIENVNLRAAYIHALGDLIQNIGVLIASSIIWYSPKWTIVDPLCTMGFSILVCFTTLSIVRDALNVLMEGTPRELDIKGLREDLAKIEGVVEVHDLHVWSLSMGKPSLACHMVIDSENQARKVLRIATRICQKQYNILHTTIQTDFSTNKSACDTNAHSKCH